MSDSAAPDERISQADTITYWSSVPCTVDGMLGGYPQVSRIDLRGSLNFLAKLRKSSSYPPSTLLPRGVDCGAGIGRVTAGFMSHVCEIVDVVEPVEKFAVEAAALKPNALGKGRIGNVFTVGLENWTPGADGTKYDLIWHQWCLGHLKDSVLVKYLQRCKDALVEGGWVVVKENITTGGVDLYDDEDSSVTRTEGNFKRIFDDAGWKVVRKETQSGFPKELGLYPVRFWALRPNK